MPLAATELEGTFNCKEEGIEKLLSSILMLNLQHEPNEKVIVSVINRLLSVSKHRKEGLEYLNLIINSCSSSIIIDNALSWINHCIVKFPNDVLREMKLQMLGNIIEVAHDQADFNKKFVSDCISKVLDNCITTTHVNYYECKAALKTLVACMKYYPSWFGQQKEKVQKFILIFFDAENIELVEAAGLALHYLQQCGGAGANGVNHKINFSENFYKLCRTAHKLYDTFFENESEFFTYDGSDEDTFEFPENPTQNFHSVLYSTARRIRNVYKFIEIAIKIRYPVPKETQPKKLLEMIMRALSFHKCITGNSEESLETYQFSLQLLEFQCAALKLLRLILIWYQSNILPFSYPISKTIVDSIERIHNCNCYKVDSLYSEAVYRALTEWLPIAKSSLHPNFQSHILECILLDITPIQLQMTLTISDAVSGKKSQKAKRKAMVDRVISSGNISGKQEPASFDKISEKNACQFALTALKRLLECTTLNVEAILLGDLCNSVLDSLLNIQSGKAYDLYNDPGCQSKLYDVFVALYRQHTAPALPPLHTSLNILKNGANDQNRFIAESCQRGLGILESVCQPICPSLFIGLDKELNEEEEDLVMSQSSAGEDMEASKDGDTSANFEEASEASESHNNSAKLNTTEESTAYQVRYTESDRSTIDDGLSDKGEQIEKDMIEELNAEMEFKQGEEMSVYPVVTAPSEDGNEILEGQHIQDEELDPNKEETTNQETIESEMENIQEENVKDEDINKKIKVVETIESELKLTFSDTHASKSNEETLIREDQLSAPELEAVVESTENVTEDKPSEEEVEAEVTDNRKRKPDEDTEETSKKIKVIENAENEPLIDSGKLNEDPDASYLEDDSFVDEVRDYSN